MKKSGLDPITTHPYYFGYFLENYRSSSNFGASFFYGKSYAQIMTKSGLAYILGIFSRTHLVALFVRLTLE
jgi:hypothetical protein